MKKILLLSALVVILFSATILQGCDKSTAIPSPSVETLPVTVIIPPTSPTAAAVEPSIKGYVTIDSINYRPAALKLRGDLDGEFWVDIFASGTASGPVDAALWIGTNPSWGGYNTNDGTWYGDPEYTNLSWTGKEKFAFRRNAGDPETTRWTLTRQRFNLSKGETEGSVEVRVTVWYMNDKLAEQEQTIIISSRIPLK
ncbi:MAG: hypothetical protein A2Z15_06775 [Chloroflexi bacterium RBG_16_50_11]|nr:MAG: hypothetical protein A2Z15_06775 [Chloroflexi bacterium RBG_16_50_11]